MTISVNIGSDHIQDSNSMYFATFHFDLHPHAQHAAEAAEASAAQNKFWEVHDYLFEHQKALDDHHLLEYVQKVGLDIDKFKNEMSRHTYAPVINASLKSGIDSGVEGTPTLSMECVMITRGI